MQPEIERRHREREKYLVLRLYARVLSGLGYGSATVGLLFGVLIFFFGDMPVPLRISNGFISLLLGATYFLILRATAEAIYLLFDVARNSKAIRETLEKPAAAAPPTAVPQPRPVPGD